MGNFKYLIPSRSYIYYVDEDKVDASLGALLANTRGIPYGVIVRLQQSVKMCLYFISAYSTLSTNLSSKGFVDAIKEQHFKGIFTCCFVKAALRS